MSPKSGLKDTNPGPDSSTVITLGRIPCERLVSCASVFGTTVTGQFELPQTNEFNVLLKPRGTLHSAQYLELSISSSSIVSFVHNLALGSFVGLSRSNFLWSRGVRPRLTPSLPGRPCSRNRITFLCLFFLFDKVQYVFLC